MDFVREEDRSVGREGGQWQPRWSVECQHDNTFQSGWSAFQFPQNGMGEDNTIAIHHFRQIDKGSKIYISENVYVGLAKI